MSRENGKQKKTPLYTMDNLSPVLGSSVKHVEEFLDILNKINEEEYKKYAAPIRFEAIDADREPATKLLDDMRDLKDKLDKKQISIAEGGQAYASIEKRYTDLMNHIAENFNVAKQAKKYGGDGEYDEFEEKYADFYSSYANFAEKTNKYKSELGTNILISHGRAEYEKMLIEMNDSLIRPAELLDTELGHEKLSNNIYDLKSSIKESRSHLTNDSPEIFNTFESIYTKLLTAEFRYTQLIRKIDEYSNSDEVLTDEEESELRKYEKHRPELEDHLKLITKHRESMAEYIYPLYGIEEEIEAPEKIGNKQIDQETINGLSDFLKGLKQVVVDEDELVSDYEVSELNKAFTNLKESFEKGDKDLSEKGEELFSQIEGIVAILPSKECLKDLNRFDAKTLPKENLDILLGFHNAMGKFGPVLSQRYKPAEPEIQENAKEEIPKELSSAEKERFKKMVTALEQAKTMTNSKEYKEIIESVKELANDNVSNKVEKLVNVSVKIDSYLAHKSKDGVKPNVFKKFAAVESLSKEIENQLKEYKDQEVEYNGNHIKVSDIELSPDVKSDKLNDLVKSRYERAIKDDHFSLAKVDQEMATYDEAEKAQVKGFMDPAHTCLKKVIFKSAKKCLDTDNLSKVLDKFGDVSFACNELGIKAPEKKKEMSMTL